MNIRRTLRAMVIGAALLGGTNAMAQPDLHSLVDIEATAINHVRERHATNAESVTVERLDQRLRLAKCSDPLQAVDGPGTRAGGQRILVQINCRGERRWKLYVSVALERSYSVVVARHYLQRGHIVTVADLATRDIAVSALRDGFSTDPQDWLGKALKQAADPGAVLYAQLGKQPLLIRRGQRLDLLVAGPGVTIRMAGEALEEGRKGQQIKVKNLSSNRVVHAIVKNLNEAQVATM